MPFPTCRHGNLRSRLFLPSKKTNGVAVSAAERRNCYWFCTQIERNYLIFTIIVLLVISYLLPDLSHKYHLRKKLNHWQNVLDLLKIEVKRAEVACLTAADEVHSLRCFVRDNCTETFQNLQDHSVCTSKTVTQTRSAPVQVEKKIGFFRRIFFPYRNVSNKEIALMSYVYTNSFDSKKLVNESTTTVSEFAKRV